METLKNFFIGVVVIVLSLIIFGIVVLTWPFLVGISSLILSVFAAVLFLVFIFYVIVLVGHLIRQMMKKSQS
ncbi:MAG: hypothetical protein KAI70_07370 [Candidatus Omnitrophica bacterium]|nr:hypothetical protein [Candidatus Omnitrophota bacterium]